jgi:hypothetical protein
MIGYLTLLATTTAPADGSGLNAGHYWAAVVLIMIYLGIQSLLR